MGQFSLSKKERLKNAKTINALFSEGSSLKAYPIRLVFLQLEKKTSSAPFLFSVSVPKRSIKSAVKRNLIKRRIREAYRNQKLSLLHNLKEKELNYAVMFLYYSRSEESYDLIYRSVERLLRRFEKQLVP